jgi:hypothetical protein
MSITIKIEGTPEGTVLIDVEGETTAPPRAKKAFDLIIPALRGYYQPKPKSKRTRQTVEFV